MAKLIDPNYDSPMQIYEEVPDPPWYQPALDVVTGKNPVIGDVATSAWEGIKKYSTQAPAGSPYDVRPALGIPSETPKEPESLAGPAYTPEETKTLEDSSRLLLEIYAGLLTSGLLPAAAIPSAMTLMRSGKLIGVLRNLGPEAVRKSLIAAAPAAVDVATGAPEEAPRTFGYSLMGEYLGGTPANVASKVVGPRVAAQMGTSTEGAITKRVLDELNVPAPLAAQSKAAWTQRVEDALRSSFGGEPLRRAQREGTEAITGKITQPVREWPDEAVRRPPVTTGTAKSRYEEMPTTPYGETTTLPEPPVTTGRPAPSPEPNLPAEVTGRLGLPRSPGGAGELPATTSTLTRQPHEAFQEAFKEHNRILGKAESMSYGQIDDVILKQRPDTGGARVPPPRAEPFTPPVEGSTPTRPPLPERARPPGTPATVGPPTGEPFTLHLDLGEPVRPPFERPRPPLEQPPIPFEHRAGWVEPGDPTRSYQGSRPVPRPESTREGPMWRGVPEEAPYDPAATEALYGTGRFAETPRRTRTPGSPEPEARPPLWENVPEGTPYDPASTEARYGTRRFENVPPRERPPVAPAGPSPLVDARYMKDEARAMLKDTAGLRVPGADNLLKQILDMPDRVSFEVMAKWRGDLLAVTRQSTDLIPGKATEYAARIAGAADQEMATTARAFGPDTYKAWRDANAMTKANAAVFEKPAVKRLLSADADTVFGTAATSGSPYAIREAREAINNPLLWQQVQDAWMRKTVGTYTDPLTGQMSGAGMLQYLKQSYKDGALKELLPAGHAERLLDFSTALTQLQRGGESARGVGRVLHFTPTGGLAFPIVGAYEAMRHKGTDDTGLPGWVLPTAGGVTLFAITPRVLSRIMAKPELMRWTIEGMKVAPSTKRAHEVGGMLLGLLAKEGLLEEQAPAASPASP